MSLHFYLLIVYVVIAFYMDIRYNKIPNWLTITAVIVGIGYHLVTGMLGGVFFSLLGIVISVFVLILLYFFKALAAGDVKFFAGVGALTGMEFSLYSILYSVIFAGFISLIILLLFKFKVLKKFIFYTYRWILTKLKKEPKHSLDSFLELKIKHYPFMYAVVPGILVTFYYF
ncbi:A24 family peptidase [Gracilibacillus massiliensis]|uniref:A24 family peptidase n=1 Tax=Gracilibacillus massiliensis TaxID=1564956 RepID=UPI00071C3B62|nr:prepilin peptidase [Gracilibacillus massiliensis]